MNHWIQLEQKVHAGVRLSDGDALFLFETPELLKLGQLADLANRKKHGHDVFFNVNRHINPTNICVMTCKFCAYSRKPGEEGGYEYSIEEMLEKAQEALEAGATEVHIVGGLHPRWKFDYYKEMLSAIKGRFPSLHIKGFTAVEIDWLAQKARKTIKDTLITLREAGLDSLPGGGAEVFHQDVRDEITAKLTADEWLEIHRTAHELGMKSNCTMLYGHVESFYHRVDHLRQLRALQDETNGFNAFIPLSFQPHQNDMGITRYTFGVDDLKMIAVARLYLDNFEHIKSYWIMSGQDIAQIAMQFGANDLDGTVIEEKISRMAGGRAGMGMSRSLLETVILRAGKNPVERDTLYQPLRSLGAPARPTVPENLLAKLRSNQPQVWDKTELMELAQADAFHELSFAAQKVRPSRKVFIGFSKTVSLKSQLTIDEAMAEISKVLKLGSEPEVDSLILDLAGLAKTDGSLSLTEFFEIITQVRGLRPHLSLGVASLKGLWHLALKSHVEFEAAVLELKTLGVASLEPSYIETEGSLTHSEVRDLHLAAHRAGMKTSGKVELAVPPGRDPALWQSFMDRLLVYREIQNLTEGLTSLNIEPAKGSQVFITEYLSALAIARIAVPSVPHITAPLLKIPALSPAKGEGTKITQHPSEKVAPMALYMGASDFGLVQVDSVSEESILQDIRSAGFLGLLRNAAWQELDLSVKPSLNALRHVPKIEIHPLGSPTPSLQSAESL